MPRRENYIKTDRSTSETNKIKRLRQRFNMESSYDYQKRACKKFFVNKPSDIECDEIKEDEGPSSVKTLTGPKYNITGLNGQQVVALLSTVIVPDQWFVKNKTFYLFIQGETEDKLDLFQLQANPTVHQPGNAVVSLRPRKGKTFKPGGAKKYEELNGALKACYDEHDENGKLVFSDTVSFAKDIKKLFKDNRHIYDVPEVTSEAYMILLFEIARRLAKSTKLTDEQKKLDALPIGSAIAEFLQLLSDGQLTFNLVFIPRTKYHCFTGTPEVRKNAIKNINDLFRVSKNNTEFTLDYYLEELKKCYS